MCQKGGEYSREYTREYCHFYMTCAHSKEKKFYFLCTFLGGESLSEDAYIKEEKTFIIKKTMFCLFSWLLYGALSYV